MRVTLTPSDYFRVQDEDFDHYDRKDPVVEKLISKLARHYKEVNCLKVAVTPAEFAHLKKVLGPWFVGN